MRAYILGMDGSGIQSTILYTTSLVGKEGDSWSSDEWELAVVTGASLGRSSGGVMEGVLKEGKSAQRGQRPGQPWCDLKKKKKFWPFFIRRAYWIELCFVLPPSVLGSKLADGQKCLRQMYFSLFSLLRSPPCNENPATGARLHHTAE